MILNRKELFRDKGILNSYLLIFLAFCLPVSVAGVNLTLFLMVLVFLWEKDYTNRFKKIQTNPLIYLIFAFVGIHLIGCLWSDNLPMAIETLQRVKKLLWIPFLMMFVKKEHTIYYLQSFVIGMMLSEILTYLVWLDILPLFMYATEEMPSPLMKHTYYTPYIAMGIFLLSYFLLYKKHKSLLQKVITGFFLLTMLVNLFISGGRGGQVGFFVLFLVLILYYFRGRLFKGIILFGVMSSILFALAYSYIPLFESRADKAVYEVTHFEQGEQTTSLGIRMALNKNYFEIFLKHPVFGVGTGDYKDEYKVINEKSVYQTNIIHPHNMHMLILVQFGLLGMLVFLSIFMYQIYYSIKIKDDLQVLRIAFPLFFLVIMTVNWYLYTFNTMFLFIFFSAILFYHYDKKIEILN
jgi:O-antigen ligase